MKIKDIKNHFLNKMKINKMYTIKANHKSKMSPEELIERKIKFLGFTGQIGDLMLFENIKNKTKICYSMIDFVTKDKYGIIPYSIREAE